jgi:NAD(P)-dependent dehydrogenase (short-subunit alcohol dehydrogenase family)
LRIIDLFKGYRPLHTFAGPYAVSPPTEKAMKTWFITGISSGFGKALADELLGRGDRVAGTVRSEAQSDEFAKRAPSRSFGFVLDVTDSAAVPLVVAEVERTVGPIDVLVNNAGYGYEGPVEEAQIADVRRQYEVNVFGALSVMQGVLPFMRARKSGHIINITSMGGLTTFPGVGIYNSSKFALEAINEALAAEVREFNIKVTAVEPGNFRTEFAGRSMHRGARSIADYDALFEPQRKMRQARSGNQIGDPKKAARAIADLAKVDLPPLHLLLGSDALQYVRASLADLNREIDQWEKTTLSTDFDQ